MEDSGQGTRVNWLSICLQPAYVQGNGRLGAAFWKFVIPLPCIVVSTILFVVGYSVFPTEKDADGNDTNVLKRQMFTVPAFLCSYLGIVPIWLKYRLSQMRGQRGQRRLSLDETDALDPHPTNDVLVQATPVDVVVQATNADASTVGVEATLTPVQGQVQLQASPEPEPAPDAAEMAAIQSTTRTEADGQGSELQGIATPDAVEEGLDESPQWWMVTGSVGRKGHNVRDAPKGEIVEKLHPGNVVCGATFQGTNKDWLSITYNGQSRATLRSESSMFGTKEFLVLIEAHASWTPDDSPIDSCDGAS